MTCDRCGRLLNRATGRCVCDDYGGVAPPPVATTHPPVNAAAPAVSSPGAPLGSSRFSLAPSAAPHAAAPAVVRAPSPAGEALQFAVAAAASSAASPPAAAPAPLRGTIVAASSLDQTEPDVALPSAPAPAPTPEADLAPISTAAAFAVLDLSDRPARPPKPVAGALPPAPALPAAPPPPVRAAGAPVGVLRAARAGRAGVDAVAYDGVLVLASRGASLDLLAPQLAAQDLASRRLDANLVDDVVVREDRAGGKATIRLRSGEVVALTWPGRRNRGVAAENLLAHAFPGKVDQGSSELGRRAVRTVVKVVAAVVLLGGAAFGLSVLLHGDPPPPPPAAPPVTLPPAEQTARAELQAACPPWQAFAAAVPAGERPDPTQLRPIVDGIRPRFDNAAGVGADPSYATARDEVAYLQDYARRTPEAVGLESVSRVTYALRTVSAACTKAGSVG